MLSPAMSWFLCLVFHTTTSQKELGFILESPETAVVPLGSVVNFTCRAVGFIFWEVNKVQVVSSMRANLFAGADVFVPLSTENSSVVTVIAALVNNNSNLTCIVEPQADDYRTLNKSSAVQLIAYGEPSSPSQLIVSVASQGIGVNLTWQPGFALDGEHVVFIVSSEEVSSGRHTQLRTDFNFAVLSPEVSGNTCQTFNFSVYSENGFSRSSTAVSQSVLLPAEPLPLTEVNVSVSFQPSLQAKLQFNAPSPCDSFSVDTYNVTFFEIANSMKESLQPAFTINRHSADSIVSLIISAADGILLGRQYNFTIFASNIAGLSDFSGSLFTTGLQSALVIFDLSVLHIACEFANGSDAVGCQVSLSPLLVINVTRASDMTVATQSLNLSEDFFSEMVTVAEILEDGRVSSINVQAKVTVSLPRTAPLPMTATAVTPSVSTTAAVTPLVSTIAAVFLTGTDNCGSYLVVAVAVSVVVTFLITIILYSALLQVGCCIVHARCSKSSNTIPDVSSGMAMKDNNAYGPVASGHTDGTSGMGMEKNIALWSSGHTSASSG